MHTAARPLPDEHEKSRDRESRWCRGGGKGREVEVELTRGREKGDGNLTEENAAIDVVGGGGGFHRRSFTLVGFLALSLLLPRLVLYPFHG